MNPLIFDIQRSSLVDGPGIRTTVYFKGCNLDCRWCHNPESKSAVRQIAFFEEKCTGCGVCKEVCLEPAECKACGECALYCAYGARKVYGKQYSVSELADIIAKDKNLYDRSGGGATFSGGECMLYPDFIAALASECKQNGISVAIDTAGCVEWSSFERVLPFVDIFLYDIKCIDEELHRKFTGRSNGLILENFERLTKTDKRIIVRVPVIPYFNEGEQMEKIRDYLARFRVEKVEYLPYHDMGEGKKSALLLAKNKK